MVFATRKGREIGSEVFTGGTCREVMMASDVPAVLSAVRILERIARSWPEPVPSGVLIEELELNRSTCYNILGTLQRAGWASSRGDRGGWSLGPGLLALARVSEDWMAQIVQQELDTLSEQLGSIAFAVQRQGHGAYSVLAKGDRGKGVRITVGVGDTFPFSAPAIMRAFYAWSEPDEVDALIARYGLEAFTPETVVDPGKLREVLRETRERGYSRSLREYDLGQSGVAAPVFDAAGHVSMVICSLAFASELNESNVERYGELIREGGRKIQRRTANAEKIPG